MRLILSFGVATLACALIACVSSGGPEKAARKRLAVAYPGWEIIDVEYTPGGSFPDGAPARFTFVVAPSGTMLPRVAGILDQDARIPYGRHGVFSVDPESPRPLTPEQLDGLFELVEQGSLPDTYVPFDGSARPAGDFGLLDDYFREVIDVTESPDDYVLYHYSDPIEVGGSTLDRLRQAALVKWGPHDEWTVLSLAAGDWLQQQHLDLQRRTHVGSPDALTLAERLARALSEADLESAALLYDPRRAAVLEMQNGWYPTRVELESARAFLGPGEIVVGDVVARRIAVAEDIEIAYQLQLRGGTQDISVQVSEYEGLLYVVSMDPD